MIGYVWAGFYRNTIVKRKIKVVKKFALVSKCLECNGSGIFDCGIPEEKGPCRRCKSTGKEYFGTI